MERRNLLFKTIAKNLKRDGLENEVATNVARQAMREGSIQVAPIGYGPNVEPVVVDDDACTNAPINCDEEAEFRTFTGRCNNLINPYWGATATAFPREIPVSTYNPKSGGIYPDRSAKYSISGKPTFKFSFPTFCPNRGTLPSARFVSQAFHTSENVSATTASHMLTQWGQFLSHDNTLTPFPIGNPPDCCREEGVCGKPNFKGDSHCDDGKTSQLNQI